MIETIEELPSVKAPNDFVVNLKKKIEAPAGPLDFFKTLFFPLNVKLPIQLVSATAIAVVIFFVVAIQNEKNRSIRPNSIEIALIDLNEPYLLRDRGKLDGVYPDICLYNVDF